MSYVLSGLFESIRLSFKSSKNLVLEDALGESKFVSRDGRSKCLEFSDSQVEDVLRLVSGTSHAQTEETRVGEVEVQGFRSINVRVLLEQVLAESVRVEQGCGNVERSQISRAPSNGVEKQRQG